MNYGQNVSIVLKYMYSRTVCVLCYVMLCYVMLCYVMLWKGLRLAKGGLPCRIPTITLAQNTSTICKIGKKYE
jgi:hypothetical protein